MPSSRVSSRDSLWPTLPSKPLTAHLAHEALLHFAAAAAHGFEHFGHLGVLFQEVVDFLDAGAGAGRDAFAAAAVD
jgi:hypothetical protein